MVVWYGTVPVPRYYCAALHQVQRAPVRTRQYTVQQPIMHLIRHPLGITIFIVIFHFSIFCSFIIRTSDYSRIHIYKMLDGSISRDSE